MWLNVGSQCYPFLSPSKFQWPSSSSSSLKYKMCAAHISCKTARFGHHIFLMWICSSAISLGIFAKFFFLVALFFPVCHLEHMWKQTQCCTRVTIEYLMVAIWFTWNKKRLLQPTHNVHISNGFPYPFVPRDDFEQLAFQRAQHRKTMI